MSDPVVRFPLRVDAASARPGGPADAEDFALALDEALADLDVVRIDRAPGGAAPEGTRGVELMAAFDFIITAVEAGEALAKVVEAIRRVAQRFRAQGRPLAVTVGPSAVDLATAPPEQVVAVVGELLALPSQARAAGRYALVVANSAYDDTALAGLRSPGADADELVRVLGDPSIGGFTAEALRDADERTIRRRLAAFFAGRDRDDLLLVHFSCHGIKDERGRLHLAARDTDLALLGATAIPAGFVNDLLSTTQSQRVVLMLDCCYSGAFARGTASRADEGVQIADEFGGGSGRIVLTASSATEYAFEDGELTRSEARPSVFTGAIVTGLATGAADLDGDGEISIDELYDYTYRTVRASTPGQAPRKWVFGLEGDLVVARSVRPAALPDAVAADLASDRVVLRLEGVRELATLLRTGKSGLRGAAVRTLVRVRDEDDSVRVRQAATDALAAYTGAPATAVATRRPAGASDAAEPIHMPPPAPAFRQQAAAPEVARETAPVAAAVPAPPASPRTPRRRTETMPSAPTEAVVPTAPVGIMASPRSGSDRLFTGRVRATGPERLGPALKLVVGLGSLTAIGLYFAGLAGEHDLRWYASGELGIGAALAIALLVTRRIEFVAAGAGMLVWEVCWPSWDLADGWVWAKNNQTTSAQTLINVANLLAIVISLVAVATVVAERRPANLPRTARIVVGIAVAACTLPLIHNVGTAIAQNPDHAEAVTNLAVVAALAVAVVVVFGPGRAPGALGLGWLVGGLSTYFGGNDLIAAYNDEYFRSAQIAWWATVVTAIITVLLVGYSLVDRFIGRRGTGSRASGDQDGTV